MDGKTSPNRRLAAVMFLDMVGFSAMMSRNETRALEHVRQLEKVVRALIPSHGGRLVKFLGDGTLAEFPTAVSAVLCAKAILANLQGPESLEKAPDLKVRVGLHLGELLEHDGDIFGDAVNIAARVQPLADPNAIAMSEAVHAQIKNQMSLPGGFLSPQKLKNIPGRQRIFVVVPSEQSLRWWTVRRRAFPVCAAGLVVAAVLAGGAWLWKNGGSEPPLRFAYVFTATRDQDAESARMAKSVDLEMELEGPRIRGARWMDRIGIYETYNRNGVKDLTAISRGESGLCLLTREMGLRFPMIGRLERKDGGWRLETRATDTEDLSVVGVFTADGATSAVLAQETVRQVQRWIDEHKDEY